MRRSFPNVESFAVQGPWKSAQSGSENLIFSGSPLEQRTLSTVMANVNRLVWATASSIRGHCPTGYPTHSALGGGVVLTDD